MDGTLIAEPADQPLFVVAGNELPDHLSGFGEIAKAMSPQNLRLDGSTALAIKGAQEAFLDPVALRLADLGIITWMPQNANSPRKSSDGY